MDVVAYRQQDLATPEDIRGQVNRIQAVMQAVMKSGTHYGKIPGTDKPSLYKPGAEVLCATFRIAPEFHVTDLSDGDQYRYRVSCIGIHQMSGTRMGEGLGACSSSEEKYKWRKAVCDGEYDAAPETRRRLKWSKWDGKVKSVQQVRAEPEDIDNTVLKMACKRALVAMVLNVTAASDIFAQDLEDLPEHLRTVEDEPKPEIQQPRAREPQSEPRPEAEQPKRREPEPDAPRQTGEPKAPRKLIGAGEIAYLKKAAEQAKVEFKSVYERFGLAAAEEMDVDQFKDVRAWLRKAA